MADKHPRLYSLVRLLSWKKFQLFILPSILHLDTITEEVNHVSRLKILYPEIKLTETDLNILSHLDK